MAAFLHGRCSESGWMPEGTRADGPNCTFVGSRSWTGQLMLGSCARNVRSALEQHSKAFIESLLSHPRGGGGGAVIFEDEQRSGDPDGTRTMLRSWASRDPRIRLLLAAPLLYPRWSRTQRLALCRNMLVHEALEVLPERGMFIALDLDCRFPSPREIALVLSAMATMGHWDVLTANTRPPSYYYDRWALRSNTLGLAYDCWFNKSQRTLYGSCPDYAITVDPNALPFAVDSAFNGVGIYRASALRVAVDCRYRGTKNSYLCEHVPFHLCMRSHQLNIGVLPSLGVDCGVTQLSPQHRRRYVHMLSNGSVEVQVPFVQRPSAIKPAIAKTAFFKQFGHKPTPAAAAIQ